jgi:outer membrane protein OmpA-like peptidoglycan-associated protein
MQSKLTAFVSIVSLGLCFAVAIKPAHAQYFSDHDGYTDSGAYRVQLEVSPYLWLPATSGAVGFAREGFADHFSGEFSSSVPPVGEIASHLHFSFMGDTVLRYGPYSGEVDLQYVDAFAGKTRFTPDGPLRVHTNASYVRLAPGFGYQVYGGDIFRIPTSVDARIGFAYFTHWEDLKGEGNLVGEVGGSGNFIQPWAGTRIAFIPAPSWRIEVAGLVQGFAVNGGGWGWGASAVLSYAVTDWFALDAGYRALSTDRHMGDFFVHDATGGRTLNFTAYGPVAGMSLRLGSNPPPPPLETAALAAAAAPAPAAAKTYLVFFDWDKSELTPRATAIIAQAAANSKIQSKTTLDVSGYTDTSGTAVYNAGLSERRAQAVAAQLVADGVPAAVIEIHAYGETHLLVPTGPGVREPQNRRVEIILE